MPGPPVPPLLVGLHLHPMEGKETQEGAGGRRAELAQRDEPGDSPLSSSLPRILRVCPPLPRLVQAA